jgi:glutamate synthase (NADPH/NADH) small chain
MADPRGFLELPRAPEPQRDPRERTADHGEIFLTFDEPVACEQATRCMDCGVPFCHTGCPLGNLIPEWNDLVRLGRWREAVDRLHLTNNFPEFTGLICPAPCEPACVLAINDDPVAIEQIEWSIIERAFREGWVRPRAPVSRTGRSVAVVGSGPAGMAVAEELNVIGHRVVVFERDEAPGGLMRFGVPDFKLEKWIIDRRIALMEDAGVEFSYGVEVAGLPEGFDALVWAVGARVERALSVPGADLDGVHFAMEYLYGRNRWVASSAVPAVSAAGQRVVVIGGGDTAADCVASAHREKAASVVQLDTYPVPFGATWPDFPKRMPSTYALDEGGERRSALSTTGLVGSEGRVTGVSTVEVGAPPAFDPVVGTESVVPADLVLVAIGFTGPEREEYKGGPFVLGPREFVCGDARVGASLVVTAIAEGRECAAVVDRALA